MGADSSTGSTAARATPANAATKSTSANVTGPLAVHMQWRDRSGPLVKFTIDTSPAFGRARSAGHVEHREHDHVRCWCR